MRETGEDITKGLNDEWVSEARRGREERDKLTAKRGAKSRGTAAREPRGSHGRDDARLAREK